MPSTTESLEGRWTIYVCTGCGEATGRHNACDAKREATPVVPCHEAAIERVAEVLYNYWLDEGGPGELYEDAKPWLRDEWLERARETLAAAGESA